MKIGFQTLVSKILNQSKTLLVKHQEIESEEKYRREGDSLERMKKGTRCEMGTLSYPEKRHSALSPGQSPGGDQDKPPGRGHEECQGR